MRFYLLASFLFVAILWHSCWSDCNPYKMIDPIEVDSSMYVQRPYVDSLQPDTIKWKTELSNQIQESENP